MSISQFKLTGMNTKKLIVAPLLLLMFISCDKTKKENSIAGLQLIDKQTEPEQKKVDGNFQGPVVADSVAPTPSGITKQVSNPDWDKKIIKTATLKLEVKDFQHYNESLHKTIKQYGGYIANEEQNLSDEKTETVMSIKVPVEQFETMMNQLPGEAVKVIERKITTDDVTGEVVDIKSRLEAKKEMRLKYLEFLKQSKNMAEVLQVQQEINGIQEEIEAAAGRVGFLSQQASFSTINLIFFQPVSGFKPTDSNPNFFTRISLAFRSGVNWFADIFVGLMSIWPFILMLVIAFVAWKRSKIRKPIRQNA